MYSNYMVDQSILIQLSISHGQVLTVIETMNIVSWLSRPSLDSVLKKFRIKSVPNFKKTGQIGRTGSDFAYGYTELMDCIVAMKLVADGLTFRHVGGLMTFDPERLAYHYRRGFL